VTRTASLAQAEIEQALGGASPRLHENSLRRALWRSLLLPAGDVLRAYWAGLELWRQRVAPPNEGPATRSDVFQAMASTS